MSTIFTKIESYRSTVTILTQATNIRDLDLCTFVDRTSHPGWRPVLEAVCQMKLIKFTFYAAPSDNDELCRILSTQPTLEEIVLDGNALNLGQLDATALPKLKRLTAGLVDVVALAPGRA
ncbi:hypothetical protein FRB90_007429 [Tulasnella sp. 427]|nr:hypothetical protein FRB90_007429 [Tulasnella sp. 427]